WRTSWPGEEGQMRYVAAEITAPRTTSINRSRAVPTELVELTESMIKTRDVTRPMATEKLAGQAVYASAAARATRTVVSAYDGCNSLTRIAAREAPSAVPTTRPTPRRNSVL